MMKPMNKKIFSVAAIIFVIFIFSGCQTRSEKVKTEEKKEVAMVETKEPAKEEENNRFLSTVPSACLDESENKNSANDAWLSFQGDFFSIKYPSVFNVIKEKSIADYGFFESPDRKAIFGVYSPQWTGKAKKILIQPEEILISGKNELKKLKCENEMGPDATQKIKYLVVKAGNDRYKRIIMDINLMGPDGAGETKKTYSFQYNDMKSLEKYSEDFKIFMNSLEQLSD